ncbi:MAG: hypothetical protein Q9160_003607 [Pyrenula sp. 1 TL-2023]
MHRVGTWLHPRRLNPSSSTQSLDFLAESQNLEVAMRAAVMILNDDVDGAEEGLRSGHSSFHKLGRGVVIFLRATLGFEQDVMREASERLADAEATASNDYYKAQRDSHSYRSAIYTPGSEFSLVIAMSQMMSAVVAVLSESLTESIKGFYKLRKAFVTLNALVEMEAKYTMTNHRSSITESATHSADSLGNAKSEEVVSKTVEVLAGSKTSINSVEKSQSGPESSENLAYVGSDVGYDSGASDEDGNFFDAEESHDSPNKLDQYQGHLESTTKTSLLKPEVAHPKSLDTPPHLLAGKSLENAAPDVRSAPTTLEADPQSDIFADPVDSFVHSGANCCFGVLLVLVSIIPPAFGRLLSIIGFRGDRERGLRLLWQASKFHNINGGMAGLTLLGWYNGITGFCDILPDSDENADNVEGYPLQRLKDLLSMQRSRYPKSLLWLLEDARMEAAQRRLSRSIEMLSQPVRSPLKQVEALCVFEKSLNCMYAHRYELCAESFVRCVELNSWSPALYYYIAGAAHLSVYRQTKVKDAALAREHAKKADSYLRTAPTHTGKKKMLGRQLPLDQFVNRKLAKWQAHAEQWKCDLVDAVGVNPLEEMIFLWGGYKRMNRSELEESLSNLEWSTVKQQNTYWDRMDLDERAIQAILRAAVFRNLWQHEEAKAILQSEILNHERQSFKGHLKDDWTCPIAHYEMGVNLWMQRSTYSRGSEDQTSSRLDNMDKPHQIDERGMGREDLQRDQELVAEAKQWIEKVSQWESFELDQRFGMRITVALDSIKKWEARHGVLGV